MKKVKVASAIITLLTMIALAVAVGIFGDESMTLLSVGAFVYMMLSYYTALFIGLKAKKRVFRLLPLLYVIAGAIYTLLCYDKSGFFPQLTLIFLGVPVLLSLGYICLAYMAVHFKSISEK